MRVILGLNAGGGSEPLPLTDLFGRIRFCHSIRLIAALSADFAAKVIWPAAALLPACIELAVALCFGAAGDFNAGRGGGELAGTGEFV
jgi:hypothetical protein